MWIRILTLYFIVSLLIQNNNLHAQISVSPTDTLICPNQNIQLKGQFSSDFGNITSDDIFGGVINIGFDFVFYGKTYNQCVISANNFLTFDLSLANQYSDYTYAGALASGQLDNVIMFPFQDINPFVAGGSIKYQTAGQVGSRVFVVEFCQKALFGCESLRPISQVILYEGTNIVEMHIKERPMGCYWQNGTAVQGLRSTPNEDLITGRNIANVDWGTVNDGKRFTPNGNTTYTISNITFNPFPLLEGANSSNIEWYAEGDPYNPVATGANVTVRPDGIISYYVATYSGATTCNDTNVFTVRDTVRIYYDVKYDTIRHEICSGDAYYFIGSRMLTSPGIFDTVLTTTKGCDSFVRLYLTVNPLPSAELFHSLRNSICNGDSTMLKLLHPDDVKNSYQWFQDSIRMYEQTKPELTVHQAGRYHVVVTSDKGCVKESDPFYLTVNPLPLAKILPIEGDVKCTYDTVTLQAQPGGDNYSYWWAPQEHFRYINYEPQGQTIRGIFRQEQTNVVLTAINEFNCISRDSVMLFAKPCCEVFVPKAFSPNGDGLNDEFAPSLQFGQLLVSMEIYNRIGKLVFQSKNINHKWNGKYEDSGQDAAQDVYMYRINYTCDDGRNYTKKGDLMLMR